MQAAFSEHHVENPEFMGIHYMDATSVEECWRLLRQTGKSICYESLANVPRYSAWLAEQDWTDAYARHKAEPAADRAQRPGEALGAEEPVAPGRARRADDGLPRRAGRLHPPRPGRLRSRRRARCRPRPRPARRRRSSATTIGRTQLDMLVAVVPRVPRRAAGVRRRASSSTSTTATFVEDPVGDHPRASTSAFGLDWTPEARGRGRREIDRESRQGGRRPSHRYDLADYGLTEDEVRAAF